jgi:hypothetical protein
LTAGVANRAGVAIYSPFSSDDYIRLFQKVDPGKGFEQPDLGEGAIAGTNDEHSSDCGFGFAVSSVLS